MCYFSVGRSEPLKRYIMRIFKWLFSRKEKVTSPSARRDDEALAQPEARDEPMELNKEERNLLSTLEIDETIGLQLKRHTRNKLEGLFKRFLLDDQEPELRGVRSLYRGKEVIVDELNGERPAADIHFFECGGYAGDKNGYIAVVKSSDPYDILRVMETDGANYNVTTEDIVAFLKKWERQIPFSITQCEGDTLVIQLETVADVTEMVREAIELCPDLVGGDDSPEQFAGVLDHIRKSREIYFWWD